MRTEARKETKLITVMAYPDWFYEVLGNKNDLSFVIVTGERGSGKSALRRCISDYCNTNIGNDILQGTILCISLDHDAPNWIKCAHEKIISLADSFCETLRDALSLSVFSYFDQLQQADISETEWLLIERSIISLKEKSPDDISILSNKLLSTYKKIKLSNEFNEVINLITMLFGRNVTGNNIIITKAVEPINDIPRLIALLQKQGFDAIYILVDEIDEFQETSRDSDLAAEAAVSILSNIRLLETSGLGFKLFLPAQVLYRLSDASKKLNRDIRFDRTLHPTPYNLEWSEDDLEVILKKRLVAYSDGEINNSLNSFTVENVGDLDKQIIKYAHGNPRHLIQLCNRIVRYTARQANKTNRKVTLEIFQNALTDYCKQCAEIYPSDSLRGLLDFGRVEFTDNEFSEKFHLELSEVNYLLGELVSLRALTKRNDIHGWYHYKIIDPRILFLQSNSQ